MANQYSNRQRPHGEWMNKRGYVWILTPRHPRCNSSGYVRRSHLVAEKMLGRHLQDDEVVHHINRNRSDDREDNILVMTQREHLALHNREDGMRKGLRKLTEYEIGQIRSAISAPTFYHRKGGRIPLNAVTITSLGRTYGVSFNTVKRIANLDGLGAMNHKIAG